MNYYEITTEKTIYKSHSPSLPVICILTGELSTDILPQFQVVHQGVQLWKGLFLQVFEHSQQFLLLHLEGL